MQRSIEGSLSESPYLELRLGDLLISRLPVESLSTGTDLVFSDFRFTAESEVEANQPWVLALFEELARTPSLPFDYALAGYCYGDQGYGDDGYFRFSEAQRYDTDALENKLKALSPDITLEAGEGTLGINLNLAEDDSLPQNFAEMVPRVYEVVDLANSEFDTCYIYPFSATGDERGWLVFSKDVQWETREGYISYSGIFYNGRFDAYGAQIKALLENTPLMQELYRHMPETQRDGCWSVWG